MGDRRFEIPYARLQGSDRARVISTMTDDDVVAALAAASRAQDPYLANVLATAAQNRLRRANAVAENIGEGLCTLDAHGAIVHVNAKAGDLFGIPPGELLGKELHAIAHPYHGGRPAGPCELETLLSAHETTRGESTLAGIEGAVEALVTVTPVVVDETIEGRVVLFQDITRRKHQEELVQRQARVLESAVQKSLDELTRRAEAERRFRELFDANPDPVVVTDAAGLVVLFNEKAREALGYGEELTGLSGDVLLAQENAELLAPTTTWTTVAAGRAILVRRKDGSEFRADVARGALTWNDGPATVTTLRDVTSRWLLDARLKEQQDQLAQAEAIANLGSWEWDLASGRVTWSDELFRIHGLAPRAIPVDLEVGMAYVHPQDRALVKERLDDARASGEAFSFEHRIVTADGRIRHVRARGSCERSADGRVFRMLGTGQDVTREHEVEAALRASEARFNLVVETVAAGILILDADGSVAYANPAARTPGMMASGSEWLDEWKGRVSIPAGGAFADLRKELRDVIRGETPVELEVGVDQTGAARFFLVNATPLREPGREPAALISFQETTALHAAEQRLRQLNDDLEECVAEQTKVLRETNAELQAFSYTVAHDLQAPLRAIEYFADELAGDPAARSNALGTIRREVRHMRELVRDLLELSRLSGQTIDRTAVDVSFLAHEVAAVLAAGAPSHDVEVVIAPGMSVNGDPTLVRVLLENLMSNSWKYTSKLEGRARIEVGMTEAGAFVVRDNGVGFDMTRAAGLFQPFVRFHARTEYEGTGIGLATAHRIVSKHGGAIWAESAPGAGTAMFFTIPAPASADAEKSEGSSPGGLKRR